MRTVNTNQITNRIFQSTGNIWNAKRRYR